LQAAFLTAGARKNRNARVRRIAEKEAAAGIKRDNGGE
jgi:hypothetical protein